MQGYDPALGPRWLGDEVEAVDHSDDIFRLQALAEGLTAKLSPFEVSGWELVQEELIQRLTTFVEQLRSREKTPTLDEARFLQGRCAELEHLLTMPDRLRDQRHRADDQARTLSSGAPVEEG